MTSAPEPQSSAGAAVERRIVTVLFADLVGFTPLSERLDAEDVAAVQDAYFATVRDTITRYGGVLEKFIGDAAMAVFGAPRAHDDDAVRAVRAGLALVSAVDQLGARLGLDDDALRVRVGVNSGEVVHAVSGPDAGRVTGDTVNTAARLQAAAEPSSVLLGELTALAVADAIDLEHGEPIGLKGKAEPVRVSRAVAPRSEPSRDAVLGSLRAPLLGRDAELARLETVAAGRVTVVAPPGVGKSRLVAELARRASDRGDHVLQARVRPKSAGPYEVVRQLMIAAGAEAELDRVVRGLPEAASARVRSEVDALLRPEGTVGSAQDVAAQRDARFATWSEALALFAGDRQSTWIVEDVHWAGPDVLAFLDRSASAPDRRIVCTARPSILDDHAEWTGGGERVDLPTLPRTDAGALVRSLVADALPSALVDAIAERSDGNPLFIEELLRTWISVGVLRSAGDGWTLVVDPRDVPLPATVQAIYGAQLDDLPADARTVARRASVTGRRFPDAAFDALGLDTLRGGLDVLLRRAFVAGPFADTLGGDAYAFRHALLRDAGYASLARVERARLHAALATWLESMAERFPDVAQLVAEHYADAAGNVPAIGASDGLSVGELTRSAAAWFERAAEVALGMAAPEAAMRLLERSLELTNTEAVVDIARRRLRHAEVLADSAELDAAIAEMEATLELVSSADAPSLRAAAAYQLARAYMQQIRFTEAEDLSGRALAAIDPVENPEGSARLMSLHAWSVAAQGRDDGAADEARRARQLVATTGDSAAHVDVLEHYAAAVDELGLGEESVWQELEVRARAAGRWRQAAVALRVQALYAVDPDDALPLLEASATVAREHGLTEQEGWADLALAETRLVRGEWDDALAAAERAIATGERYAYERLAFRTWMVAFPILAERRDASWLARYERWWGRARAHFPSAPSSYGATLTAATSCWMARARREPLPIALQLPAVVPVMANPHFLAAREIVAEALVAAGQVGPATALIAEPPAADWTPVMHASQALIAAWVAAAVGDNLGAGDHARTAVAHAEAAKAPWWLARALRAAGDGDRARQTERSLGIPSG